MYDFLTKHNIFDACLQETKLTPGTSIPVFGKYAVERRDHPTGSGGDFIILIRRSVHYTTAVSSSYFYDPITEHVAVQVDLDGAKLLIINV